MNIKQVIVIRTDLNMRKGKMAAQAAHASMGMLKQAISNMQMVSTDHIGGQINTTVQMQVWLLGLERKIVLGIDSEYDLLDLHAKAKAAGLPVYLVEDAGLTEFNGVPTLTALAIGPYESDKIDKFTTHLKLL